jgi:hypothetical protein
MNATDLFQFHTAQLEQASITAVKIHDSLGNVAVVTNFLSKCAEHLDVGGPLGDWAIRLAVPPATVLFGNYGMPPSLFRNVVLFVGGK